MMNRLLIFGILLTIASACSGSKADSYELSRELKEKAQAAKQKALNSEVLATEATVAATNVRKSPESVAEEIFKAARTGEFSILSQLCDPQGELDNDAQRLCAVASTPTPDQEGFMAYFKTGKVVSKAVIAGNTATVDIKFGGDGQREETLNMIQRNGQWYLSSF